MTIIGLTTTEPSVRIVNRTVSSWKSQLLISGAGCDRVSPTNRSFQRVRGKLLDRTWRNRQTIVAYELKSLPSQLGE